MDDHEALLARIAKLERQIEHLYGLVDTASTEVGDIHELNERVVMPLLLRLGGDAYREPMQRWLESLVQEQASAFEFDGSGEESLRRVEYWRDILRKREPWPEFPPGGWRTATEDD